MKGVTEGRIVHYVLRREDADEINRRRRDFNNIRISDPHDGAQRHVGNWANKGDHCPAIIVRVWEVAAGEGEPTVNLQVFLDGNDSLWVMSVRFDDEKSPGTCHFIEPA